MYALRLRQIPHLPSPVNHHPRIPVRARAVRRAVASQDPRAVVERAHAGGPACERPGRVHEDGHQGRAPRKGVEVVRQRGGVEAGEVEKGKGRAPVELLASG